jgi:hypothetical protein
MSRYKNKNKGPIIEFSEELDYIISSFVSKLFYKEMCKSVVKHVKEDPFYELEDYDVWDYNGEKLEIYENGKHAPKDYSVLGDLLMEFAGEVEYDSNYNEETEVETKEYDCVINRELSEFFFSELESILSTFKSRFFTTIAENTKYTENNITLSKEEFVQNKNILNSIFQEGIKDCLKKVYLKEQVKIEIEQLLPHDPKNEYLTARQLNRHFIIHVGNTNTGKTHSSLEALKNARKGLYLAPLRLLALEVQEKLNSEKVPCNLITGEEENIVIGAEHISSTVEKVNLTNFFDVCVIDECQMIGDSSRGFAWTKAILGVLAKEIHICTAPEALDLLMKIIKTCNDTFEIVEHHRDTELKSERGRFNIAKEVQEGDALVVFSKKNVLAVASDLINRGIKASIIYGSLPYNTRKRQFQRFLKGETYVVVCTDAIGMGVNLPIKRD